MRIIKYLYNNHKFLFLSLLIFGLLSAYMDSIALSSLFDGENYKFAFTMLAAAICRILYVHFQARLGANVTTGIANSVLAKYREGLLKSEDLSSLILLKGINFNNYAVRPILSIIMNGATILVMLPLVVVELKLSLADIMILLSVAFLLSILFSKYFFKSLSESFSLSQDTVGEKIQDLQINKVDDGSLLEAYSVMQRQTANIFFWAQTPRSWIEIVILISGGLYMAFVAHGGFDLSLFAGLGYAVYRLMTPANSILQSVVSLKSFKKTIADSLDI